MMISMRRMLVAIAAMVVLTSAAFGGELLITCSEDAHLVCRNAFKPGHLAINDLTFEPGGIDEGKAGDVETITLGRPAGQLKRFEIPHVLGAGIAIDKPSELSIGVDLWCQKARWDYGVLGVYWNEIRIGTANANAGEKKALKTFSFKVPASAVKKQNALWLLPVIAHRRIYLDAVKIAGQGTPSLLDAKATGALLKTVCPFFDDSRSVKGKGKVLVLNWYQATIGLFEHEALRPMQADVRVSQKWIPPFQWDDYKLVIAHGRFKAAKGEAEAIGKFLNGGGVLMITPEFITYFASGKGTPYKEVAWTGGYGSGWSRHASAEHQFYGIVTNDSPRLPKGLKAGAKLHWWGGEMTRFVHPKAPEEEVLIRVDSTKRPQAGNLAVFVHPVGKGKLIGVSPSWEPEMVPLMRNLVVDAMSE